MQQVFTNDMVAHVWAQQSQAEGRNAGGSIFFDGKAIYSYGRHFPMGFFLSPDFVALNSDGYSVSTHKHQAAVSYATRHIAKRIRVDTDTLSSLIASNGLSKYNKKEISLKAIEKAKGLIKSAASRRKASLVESDLAAARRALDTASEILGLFGYKAMPSVYKLREEILTNQESLMASFSKQLEAERKATKKRNAERLEEAKRKTIESVEAFRNGYKFYANHYLREVPVMLRLSANGEEIETSQGASFPREHGEKAWALISRLKATGQTFKRNGQEIRLGHFQIDTVDAEGNIKAGCHFVHYAEVARMAEALGLAPALALVS